MPPFFSIGVPTLNRHDLLRETLASILAQDFADFEVIVGNDYTAETLTGEMLGISDPRIRFINHPRNLREVGNMNALLAAATGRYFTWLFDDDLFEPGFLRTAHETLTREGLPPALFPRYRVLTGGDPYQPAAVTPGGLTRLTGQQFLRGYFSGQLDIISTTAFFATDFFRATVGGVEELCDSAVGLYCEYLLLVKCALLGQISCIDAPYVVFRAHPESWGASNTELHKYLQGGVRLVRRCAEVLRHPALQSERERVLLGICKIHLSKLSFVAVRVEMAEQASSLSRAWYRVSEEGKKIRSAIAAESGGLPLRMQLKFTAIMAKCLYLLLFSFGYYRWSRRGRAISGAGN